MMKRNTSVCVVLLGIFALSFALNGEAAGMISPFCTAGDVTPQTMNFCSKMVGGAASWDVAAMSSVNRIMRKAKRSMQPLLQTIEAQLSPDMHMTERSQILETCRKSYQDAYNGLKSCPGLISVGPFASYGSTLTSVYTSFEDCRDAIVGEKAEIADVTRFTNNIQKLIDVALIISKKDPRIEDYQRHLKNGDFKDSAGDPNLIGPLTPGVPLFPPM